MNENLVMQMRLDELCYLIFQMPRWNAKTDYQQDFAQKRDRQSEDHLVFIDYSTEKAHLGPLALPWLDNYSITNR
jgi:hypothetical protein